MLIVREGRMLLCRKRKSEFWILPGGRIEQGESAEQCLRREIKEELGEVDASELTFLGSYKDQAAGEAGCTVQVDVYSGVLTGTPHPHAEIEELRWFGANDAETNLAPSIRNQILPDLRARNLF